MRAPRDSSPTRRYSQVNNSQAQVLPGVANDGDEFQEDDAIWTNPEFLSELDNSLSQPSSLASETTEDQNETQTCRYSQGEEGDMGSFDDRVSVGTSVTHYHTPPSTSFPSNGFVSPAPSKSSSQAASEQTEASQSEAAESGSGDLVHAINSLKRKVDLFKDEVFNELEEIQQRSDADRQRIAELQSENVKLQRRLRAAEQGKQSVRNTLDRLQKDIDRRNKFCERCQRSM
ncbi:hypothetical protein HK102_011382 [Quaeritorhiza haematococci]|nr:hypothetical protein HK102_011382 [Quaeritorhiza haematococci]